jgi:hypothetical protein
LVPGWAWAAALACSLALSGWLYVGKAMVESEFAGYRAEVAEAARKAESRARARERAMQKETERIAREQADKQEALVARAADADRAVAGLRDEVVRLNSRPAPAAADALAFAGEARTARELLGACAARYRGVAAAADGLRDQVSGLQDFVASVCKGHELSQ